MFGYFRILAAIPGFFLSALFLMLLWGVFAADLNFTLWLAVAPLVGAVKKSKWH
jgi:hypothetical protein